MTEHGKSRPATTSSSSAQAPQEKDDLERELDKALEATFPASDPIAVDPEDVAPAASRDDAEAGESGSSAAGQAGKGPPARR